MALVEPVPGAPAAVADLDSERALVVADFHAGIEQAMRADGVSLDSRASERRERLLSLLDQTRVERVVFLGDLMHAIGGPGGAERGEIEVLVEEIEERDVAVTLVKGNHDGAIEEWVECDVTDGKGARFGDVGFAHGHTWPAREVLEAETVCVGHEHPTVRLEDSVGGTRVERVWLRGKLDSAPFENRFDADVETTAELVVFPAFNDLTGGTWVNVEGQEFLAPFLPEALPDGEAYLLDGTRLGKYDEI